MGRGSSQIERQLEEEILLPTAYYESIGRKIGRKSPHNLFSWDQKTVANIEGAKYHLQAKRRTPSYSRYAGDNHLRETMAKGAGASATVYLQDSESGIQSVL